MLEICICLVRRRPLPGFEFSTWGPGKPGYDGTCWTNDTAGWAQFAGDPNYNTRNRCCLKYNGGGTSWAELEFTYQGQSTINYLFHRPEGRALCRARVVITRVTNTRQRVVDMRLPC